MPIPHLTRTYGTISTNHDSGYKSRSPIGRLKSPKLKTWLWGLAVFAAIGFIGGTILVAIVSRDLPDPNKLSDRQVSQSTKIYDRTGEHLLYEVYGAEKRTLVNLDQIAPLAVKATIAIEDKDFYQHSGVKPLSILRAAFNNLIGSKTGGGGASTITQQLIKNTVIGDEHSYFRKIKEAILALRLEKKYSKDDIIKMYLNEVPYGSTNYGIESAAQSYFHKSAKDLNLSESATLAALIQAPSRYLNNPDALRARRDLVIKLMFDQGYISLDEKTAAQNEAMRIYRSNGIMDAPHFVLYVKQWLADQFGESAVDQDGYKVITTLDYDKQKIAEAAVKELGDKFAKSANANNAALVAIDPKTAQILTMVGSRDFFNDEIDGQFNVAVLGKRQPGSSLKPFIYTAAFEKGYTPDTVLYDTITDFGSGPNGDYIPHNYDGKEHGLVTMRKALQGSLNIPAVKTLYLVGVKNAIDFAKRFGYTTLSEDAGLSIVLGGSEVNLLEHTNGYATLADNGVYHEPVSILKITNATGDTVYEWQPTDGTEAITPELSATITSVLTDDNARAYMFGLHSTLTLADRPVAAKTGTTNDYKDAWTLGYTPSLAAGVWVGNTKPAPMKGGGNTLAGQIWNRFMKESLASTTPEQFPTSTPNDATKPVLRGSDGGIKLPINKLNGKIATASTPPGLIEERTYLPPHDILFYVNKDDPRGPNPTNPADDSQYNAWETGLQEWVARETAAGRYVTFEEPPTAYDDNSVTTEQIPQVQILTPMDGEIINSKQLDITVKASAPRGVNKVYFNLDNKLIGVSTAYPFSFSVTADEFHAGEHTLTAIAEDDQGVRGQTQIKITFNVPPDPANVIWDDGTQVEIAKTDFPRTMYLTPYRYDAVKDIKIYLISGSANKMIYTFKPSTEPLDTNGKINFTWKNFPGAGQYTLKAVATDKNGSTSDAILNISVK